MLVIRLGMFLGVLKIADLIILLLRLVYIYSNHYRIFRNDYFHLKRMQQ